MQDALLGMTDQVFLRVAATLAGVMFLFMLQVFRLGVHYLGKIAGDISNIKDRLVKLETTVFMRDNVPR